MPTIQINDVTLHYEERGSGTETIVFVHGLLMSLHMFDAQVEALKTRYRCVAVDLRGQGKSEVTTSGYDLDNLTVDIAAFIEALDCGPCHFVGLSMGGFIGMRLAITHPQLLRSLSLLETSADPEPRENVPRYKLLAFIGKLFGFRLLTGKVMPILFGRDFLMDESKQEVREYWKREISNNNRAGTVRSAMAMINREGVYQRLCKISTPTLIIVGDQDVATTPVKARRMHDAIKNSKLVIIPGAGHSSSIETPDEVTQALGEFMQGCADR
jgi:pimeloyl-ACP methyl ester carboxylesterase